MKSYYLFTRDSVKFTCDTVLLRVGVGSSDRCLMKLRLIEQYALDNDFFFRKIDEDTTFWIEQKAKELRPNSNCPTLWLRSAQVDVEKLFNIIVDGRLEIFENSLEYSKQQFKILPILDESYCNHHNFIDQKRVAPFLQRRNLSRKHSEELVNAVAGVLLLFLLFILDSLGSVLLNLS